MSSFKVRGGRPLNGTIVPAGSKNEALPLIAAALLTEHEIILENVPDIKDVRVILELMASLGVSVRQLGKNEWSITADKITTTELDESLFKQVRASLTLIGPMLSRMGEVTCPLPGGDKIGRRRIDTHLLVMEKMGATIDHNSREEKIHFSLNKGQMTGASILLDEPSVTATENAVMAAVLASGRTVIYNAACEPHVQGLCAFLGGLGARISGAGTNKIIIDGVTSLKGGRYRIQYDYIEVGSFMSLAAVTGGDITITDVFTRENEYFSVISSGFHRLGLEMNRKGKDLHIPGKQHMHVKSDFKGAIPTISDGPWPLFPADLTSVIIVTATQARGSIIVHEKMFESRMFFVDKLKYMGAQIVLCDPHRVVVVGPSSLFGNEVVSPDIRAGISLLIAALGAEGESVIHNIMQIDRGYENIDRRLQALGADIERRDS
jgi:UDP-N-acetylglucosamine 1-carboxyvinyltransferase